jgi:DNA-binding MarR family transcriptional regulator
VGVPELRRLFDDLVRVEIALWDAVDRRLRRDLGLPLGRAEVLRVVASTPFCRVQDVAGALSITVGAVSKLVDRLEAAGLCARRAHPGDRRSSLLELTEEGLRVHAAAEEGTRDELERRLGGLPGLGDLASLLATTRGHLAG